MCRTSLEELGGFSRDAFGRQSMSEKRHATLDAKSTDTYQRNKKIRDERQRQKQQEDVQAEQMARERNMQGRCFKSKFIRLLVRFHKESKENAIVMSFTQLYI